MDRWVDISAKMRKISLPKPAAILKSWEQNFDSFSLVTKKRMNNQNQVPITFHPWESNVSPIRTPACFAQSEMLVFLTNTALNRSAGDESKVKGYLPKDKQFLVTKNGTRYVTGFSSKICFSSFHFLWSCLQELAWLACYLKILYFTCKKKFQDLTDWRSGFHSMISVFRCQDTHFRECSHWIRNSVMSGFHWEHTSFRACPPGFQSPR